VGVLKRIGDAYEKRGFQSTMMLTYAAYRASGLLTQFTDPQKPMNAMDIVARPATLARDAYEVILTGLESLIYLPVAGFNFLFHLGHGGWSNYWSELRQYHILHNFGKTDGSMRTGLEAILQTGVNAGNTLGGFINEHFYASIPAFAPDVHQMTEWLSPLNLAIGAGAYVAAKYLCNNHRLKAGHPATGGRDE